MEMDGSPGFMAVDPANCGGASPTPILETLQPEFGQFQTVASDPSGTLIGVARIGDGFLVVTARGVADALNKGLFNPNRAPDPNNQQFFAEAPALDAQSNAAAALIVNAINLGSSYHESFFGSRKQNASPSIFTPPFCEHFLRRCPSARAAETSFPPRLIRACLWFPQPIGFTFTTRARRRTSIVTEIRMTGCRIRTFPPA